MRVPQITIDMMVAVIALAHERTFEKAAEEIGMITASAVHKRVQAASRLFGAPLFINSVEGMTLTAAGEAFYTDAMRAVEQTLLAEERVSARLSLEVQHLRLGHLGADIHDVVGVILDHACGLLAVSEAHG